MNRLIRKRLYKDCDQMEKYAGVSRGSLKSFLTVALFLGCLKDAGCSRNHVRLNEQGETFNMHS